MTSEIYLATTVCGALAISPGTEPLSGFIFPTELMYLAFEAS